MCALKHLILPINVFFYYDVRIWLEGAAAATAPLKITDIFQPADAAFRAYSIAQLLQMILRVVFEN